MALNDVPKLLYSNDGKMIIEDTKVGRMKKEIFDATEEQLDEMLAEFGFPCDPQFGAPGMYIQTTIRKDLKEEQKKNDVVLIPVGCTEMHGDHTVSAMDTFFVTCICEGVRRYTAKKGYPTAIALPPLNYGCHPLHHMGMPGTIVVHEDIVIGQLEDVMLGLWNDGYRKQIIINNHGQFWVIESALQRFCKQYQLPGIFRAIDWHRAVREMFAIKRDGGLYDTPFTHADEAETSCGLYLFPKMCNMDYAVDTDPMSLMKEDGGHFDNSVDSYRRPSRWSEGEGHSAMEIYATPEGVVGHPTRATVEKAKRPLLCIMKYIVMLIDEYLDSYPVGTTPKPEAMTLRTTEEMEPYMKEPFTEGWRSVYGINKFVY